MTIKLKPLSARLLASGSILMSLLLPAPATAENVAAKVSGKSTLVAFLSPTSIDADVAKAIHLHSSARNRREHDVAFNLFLKAATKGSAEAKFRLAMMYMDCEHIESDEDEASKLLDHAAKMGHKQAIVVREVLMSNDFTIGC